MTSILNSTTQITLEEFPSNKFERFGITVTAVREGVKLFLYMCADGAMLRVCLDDNGYIYFVDTAHGERPWMIYDAIMRTFDCRLQSQVDHCDHLVRSQSEPQAVIDWLGEDHLGAGDRILCCIEGSASDPEPSSDLYEQVQIARRLVGQNPQLLKNPRTLLALVGELHAQAHPPFKVTLRKKVHEGCAAVCGRNAGLGG